MVPDSVLACRPMAVRACPVESFGWLAPPLVKVRLPTVIMGSWPWDECRSNTLTVELPTTKSPFELKPTGVLEIFTDSPPRVIVFPST